MIEPDFIEDVLARVDIVGVIEDYVPLKKAGQNYTARCPFHQEKTPSFTVSPAKQFYHCFSCGAHGNAAGFLMEYLHLGFVEAIESLASRVGMTVQHTAQAPGAAQRARETKARRVTLSDILDACSDYFRRQLSVHGTAREYLAKRGLDAATIERFHLGYAPSAWQNLEPVVAHPKELEESGMLIVKDGRSYDRFRDRIMFPIRNVQGQTIGFGGRILEQGEPKYLNSPETVLFDKGRELYGLYEGREAIRQRKRVLVVEGYMDVVALAQFGVDYAVASLGTSTTPDQIRLMMRHSENIYFCYDGDAAGQKAAWRALENALPVLKETHRLKFVFLPPEHDPDSFVRELGAPAFEARLDAGLNLSDYFWQELTQRHTPATQEGKAALLRAAKPLIEAIAVPTLRHLMQQTLALTVGIDLYDLKNLWGEAASKPKSYRRFRLPETSLHPDKPMTLVEKQILSLLINPQWATHCLIPDYLVLEGDWAVLDELADAARQHQAADTGALLGAIADAPCRERVEAIWRRRNHALPEDDGLAQQAFQEGMGRLLGTLKEKQLQALQQKDPLSPEEKQLLVQLLTRR